MKVAIHIRESGTRNYIPAKPSKLYRPDTTFVLRYSENGKRKWDQLSVTCYKEAQAASLKKLYELMSRCVTETRTLSQKIRHNFDLPVRVLPEPAPAIRQAGCPTGC